MNASNVSKNLWMQRPLWDILFYSFGWVLVLIPLAFYKDKIYQALSYSSSLGVMFTKPEIVYPALVILFVLVVNYVHRHYTFALVYGEREEFMRRRGLYITMPLAFIAITAAFLYFGLFVVLLTISVLWTMYHSVAQKYGLTRIYSRKSGYGSGWIEMGLVFSWFVYLIFALLEKESPTLNQFHAGRVIVEFIGNYAGYFSVFSNVLLAIGIAFTVIYCVNEFKNRHIFSLPKNLFVISILALYSLFFYDIVVAYIVFAFSHGLEYIAFVNVFVNRKYKQKSESDSYLAKASRSQILYSGLFSLIVVGLCLLGMSLDRGLFETYIVGSSFLHFIYDGVIWKVRRPEVGRPLDIKYSTA